LLRGQICNIYQLIKLGISIAAIEVTRLKISRRLGERGQLRFSIAFSLVASITLWIMVSCSFTLVSVIGLMRQGYFTTVLCLEAVLAFLFMPDIFGEITVFSRG
jgi:hypothetical protein